MKLHVTVSVKVTCYSKCCFALVTVSHRVSLFRSHLRPLRKGIDDRVYYKNKPGDLNMQDRMARESSDVKAVILFCTIFEM